MFTVLINLKKDKKRLEDFNKLYNEQNLENIFGKIKRFDAINGYDIEIPNYWMVPNGTDHHVTKQGTYGCFLSHYTVIKKFIDSSYEILTVFEDDAGFINNFSEQFNNFYNNIPDNWEMLYLGFTNNRYPGPPKYINEYCYKTVSVNTTICYMLNKKGANNLINLLDENIKKKKNLPIDIQLCHWQASQNIYQPNQRIVRPNQNAKNSNIYK